MNIALILGVLLAIATAGDAILAKLYVGAKAESARIQQAFDSFKAQEKAAGDAAQKKADAQRKSDQLAKEAADAENDATVRRLNVAIGRLRADADRARGNLVPAAPAGSRCPPDQACFDAAALERAIRERRDRVRGLADESTQIEADLATARKWAQAPR